MSSERPQLGRRIPQPRDNSAPSEGIVRVAADGPVGSYVKYANKLIEEEKRTEFTIAGSGTAIENAVKVVEVIKRCMPHAHFTTLVGMREQNQKFESRENQADVVDVKRMVPFLEVAFTKATPMDQEQVKQNINSLIGPSRPHRRNSGPRRNAKQSAPVVDQ